MPPNDLNAEAGVIGSMIIDPSTIGPCMMILHDKHDFFKEENQTVYGVIEALYNANKPIDAMIVHSTLKTQGLLEQVGGIEYIKEIANAVPTSAHAEYYSAIVREKAMYRSLISAITSTLRECYEPGTHHAEDVFNRAEQRLFEVAKHKLATGLVGTADAIHEMYERYERERAGDVVSLPTGFMKIDAMTGGLQKGEMIVIACRPSTGKTQLLLDIHANVSALSINPQASLLFSAEQPRRQIMARMISSMAAVPSYLIRRAQMNEAQQARVSHAVGKLCSAEFWIEDTPNPQISDICNQAREAKRRKNIQLIGVDYLQLIQGPKGENRQVEVAEISKRLKGLARELDVPVILTAQLNRGNESQTRKPRSSDLRESGGIEQDADLIMLLHREVRMHLGDTQWMHDNADRVRHALLIIDKQRNGPCGPVDLQFDEEITRFSDWSGPSYEN